LELPLGPVGLPVLLIAGAIRKNNRDFAIKCDGQPAALDFVLEIAADCRPCRRRPFPIPGIGKANSTDPKVIVLM
jgi:hypothetical protein